MPSNASNAVVKKKKKCSGCFPFYQTLCKTNIDRFMHMEKDPMQRPETALLNSVAKIMAISQQCLLQIDYWIKLSSK